VFGCVRCVRTTTARVAHYCLCVNTLEILETATGRRAVSFHTPHTTYRALSQGCDDDVLRCDLSFSFPHTPSALFPPPFFSLIKREYSLAFWNLTFKKQINENTLLILKNDA
jgi:hypothetical protein